MTAKRLMVLAAMLAAAAPAMAQETSVTGVLEEQGTKADDSTVYGLVDELTGEAYFVETATGESPGDLAGQRVTAYGTVRSDSGQILTANRIELADAPQAAQPAVGGDFSGFGVIQSMEGGYGLNTGCGPGSSLHLEGDADFAAFEGDFDFASFEGQRITATGVYEAGGGQAVLRVSSIEPTTGGTTTPGGTTMGGTTAANQYEDGGTPEQAGIDLNEDGAVNETDGQFAVQTSDEGVSSAPEEGALPGTGGLILPVVGVVGAAFLLGGLLYYRKPAS